MAKTKSISKIKINKKCNRCNSEMEIFGKKIIGKTNYYLLKCPSCRYTCARSN
ncbi:MAG: hypothetical protein QXR96_00635 [Candidatus Woesearchaeota archaeon]